MISDVRQVLAEALAGLGKPVHTYPPGTATPPVVMIIPGVPYVTGYALDGSYEVNLQVQIITSIAAAQSMDELILDAYGRLVAAGINPGPVPAPLADPDAGMITARIPVTLYWKE